MRLNFHSPWVSNFIQSILPRYLTQWLGNLLLPLVFALFVYCHIIFSLCLWSSFLWNSTSLSLITNLSAWISWLLLQLGSLYLLILSLFNYTKACFISNAPKQYQLSLDEEANIMNYEIQSENKSMIPWCHKCDAYKPYRRDHHCPYCVGQRNHRYFILFLAFLTLDCLYSAICTSNYFLPSIQPSLPWKLPISPRFYLFAYLLYLLFFAVILGFLTWHLWLITQDQTQLEWSILPSTRPTSSYPPGSSNFNNPPVLFHPVPWTDQLKRFFNLDYKPWYYIFLPIHVPDYEETMLRDT